MRSRLRIVVRARDIVPLIGTVKASKRPHTVFFSGSLTPEYYFSPIRMNPSSVYVSFFFSRNLIESLDWPKSFPRAIAVAVKNFYREKERVFLPNEISSSSATAA